MTKRGERHQGGKRSGFDHPDHRLARDDPAFDQVHAIAADVYFERRRFAEAGLIEPMMINVRSRMAAGFTNGKGEDCRHG